MARDSDARSAKKPPVRGESPASLRSQIDKLDRELVKLINQRSKLFLQLQKADLGDGQGVGQFVQDDQVLARAVESNGGPLTAETVRAVFREMISGARAVDRKIRVAFLGPAYSYSHVAALHRFGTGVEHVPVGSIAAVFEEVNRGHAEFGLVPLENSTDGRIADTLDMFTRLRVQICGEVQLRIHHNLLGRCARADVAEVYSRPQALSQCRNWLLRHLPGARIIEVTSTSAAAQLAQTKEGASAIASVQAGVHYGLNVLAANIEDNPSNVTRFAVIGEKAAVRTGNDKTAAMFEVPDRPGSLADAMMIFKSSKLNLSWIESFPVNRPDGGYLFFIEIDGSESDPKVKKALQTLEKQALRLQLIGSYPRSSIID
jgi:chorismate mutase/prephenate dehydratase